MKGKKKIDGKKLRRKGKNGEYEVVSLARDMGFDAFRVPLSGASGGIKGDVIIEGKIYGVKRWKRILPRAVKRDLQNFEGVFIREDYGPWYIIIPAGIFFKILKGGFKDGVKN